MRPEEIYADVEQALRDFHSLCKLAQNPLIEQIKLDDDQRRCTASRIVGGVELKQYLDQAVTAISGLSAKQMLPQDEWQIDHYLHLRYRIGIQHHVLAIQLGYTERHLGRLHQELVLEAAELIIAQIW